MKYEISKMSKYIMSDRLYIMITAWLITGKIPNIKNPVTFYDKIQYLKINKKLEKYSDLVDKYKVRKYIKEKIGDEYLIPIIGVYKNVEEIDFNELPNRFVLKANHSSGQNIICKDKRKANILKIKNKLSKWINQNYYYKLREIQYKDIKPLILCEEYLEDESGELMDYKFFCSRGKVEFIQLDISRFSDHKRSFYDINWNKLSWKCIYDTYDENIKKPNSLNEMIKVASKLSEDFEFVRVDLYLVGEKVYFGELTFTPGAGSELYEPSEVNEIVGSIIDINKY